MSFVGLFFLTVVFLSITELLLLIKVAVLFGFPVTLMLCVLTGIVGGLLVRQQGLRTLQRMQDELASGRMPTDQILEGIALIMVGAFLMVPGFLTDAGGFLMLIPAFRRAVVRRIRTTCARHVQVHTFGDPQPGQQDPFASGRGFRGQPREAGGSGGDPDIVDVEVDVRDDQKDGAQE